LTAIQSGDVAIANGYITGIVQLFVQVSGLLQGRSPQVIDLAA